jgi:arabinogalactan endo-1,4-beta-galactosidase
MPTRLIPRRSRRRAAIVAGVASSILAIVAASAVAASGAPLPIHPGSLPPLPDGVNVAIGAHVTANSGSAPASALSSINDGDGSTRWCPSVVGKHTVTIDLGHATAITGTGITFSGEEGNDGSSYTVSTGLTPSDETPFPNQASQNSNSIVQGPLYLFAGTPADTAATVKARYVTLSYQIPREENICVQELRVFALDPADADAMQLGGDMTTLATDAGKSWTAGGTQASMLSILKSGGQNYGRIQLLVNPSDGADLANALAVASQLSAAHMKIELTLDYSDAPTSSTQQSVPAAWAGQSLSQLATTVHDYTKAAIAAFARNGTPVAEVAIGNEITQGILWPAGQLNVGASSPTDWSGLATLLKSGIQGARDGNPRSNPLKVLLDVDSASDNATSVDFFNHLKSARVAFDVIGLSYSPWLQGSLSGLYANVKDLASRYGKPIVLAEGQFPYANVTGYGTYSTAVPYPDTVPGYLISPAGQASYERDLVSLLAAIPNHDGLGVEYSTPDVAGSLGWFTAAGAAQPAASSFRIDGGPDLQAGATIDPNPPAVSVAPPAAPPSLPQPPAATGPLPPLPAGLDVAIGAKVTANSGSAPSTQLSSLVDGDGTTTWTPSTLGVHTVTVDLGRVINVTGTGITFSGQHAGDGAAYTVSAGVSKPNQTAFPNQAAGDDNPITAGALYLFSGTNADPAQTVSARYVTLTYRVPREENISVQELRVFSANTNQATQLQLGADLSTLISDNATYTLNGTAQPILSIFKTGGLNYVRLRLWINPGSPDCSPANCPSLANDLTMAKEANAAGMKLLLDFHYSDTWADPQHQNVPSAWAGQTLPQLASSIHDYTESVVQAFAANGTPADQVAIGNEITQGTLWAATTEVAGSSSLAGGNTTLTSAAAVGVTNIKVPSVSNFAAGQTISVDGESATVANVGTQSRSTTLAIAAVAGATNIKVGSVTGWSVGDTVTIDTGANAETATVSAVGTAGAAGTGVTLSAPLTLGHAPGAVAIDSGTGITLASGLTVAHPQGAVVATLVPAGATVLKVANVTNFAVGQTIAVDSGAGQETAVVASVGTSGATGTGITLAAPLTRTHLGPAIVATATPAGTSTLTVGSAANVRAGDSLFIDAGTNLVPDQQTETATVAAVNGNSITLTDPLALPHLGAFSVQDVQASGKLLFDPKTDAADWAPLTTLIKAGAQGAEAGNPAGHQMLIQLHVDRGADNATTTDWISHMIAAGVPFDVIGESYYGWYHGPMTTMRANLTALISKFHKYVTIAEDQYPQAPQGGYGTYNAADANYPDTQPGYLVTPAGQASYQRDLNSIVASLPDGKGLGVFYWDADAQGNLGMFNSQHVAQPSVFANQVGTATSTAITQSTASSSPSDTVVLTAAVIAENHAPAGNPTGSVQFLVDGKKFGAPVALDANGQAQLILAAGSLKPGNHTLAAAYAGGWYFWTSQGAGITHTVKGADRQRAVSARWT